MEQATEHNWPWAAVTLAQLAVIVWLIATYPRPRVVVERPVSQERGGEASGWTQKRVA